MGGQEARACGLNKTVSEDNESGERHVEKGDQGCRNASPNTYIHTHIGVTCTSTTNVNWAKCVSAYVLRAPCCIMFCKTENN